MPVCSDGHGSHTIYDSDLNTASYQAMATAPITGMSTADVPMCADVVFVVTHRAVNGYKVMIGLGAITDSVRDGSDLPYPRPCL